MSIRIPVRVCAPSKPRQTKTGKTLVTQDVVVDRGDESPLILTRTYFDEKHVLAAGQYTAHLTLYTYLEKDEKGYSRQKGGFALGDLQPTK